MTSKTPFLVSWGDVGHKGFTIVLKLRRKLKSERAKRRRHRAEKRLSKRVLLESPFLLCPLRFALKTPENLKGAEQKRTLQKHPFA